MLAEYIKYDIKIMFRKRTFRFAFFGMLCLAIGVPIFNLIKYWGEYEYALPSAHTLYIANGDGNVWSYLSLIVPFLISLPFGFSFLDEYKSGVILYVQTRGERKSYYYAQMITCFLGTVLVILLPFLLNILLNEILFLVNGNDFISTYNVYDRTWANRIMGYGFWKKMLSNGMIFKHIAIDYPQLYNVIFAFLAAFAMGIFSMFIYAISLLVKKQTIWLLIISYLFFQVFTVFDRIMEELSRVYINLKLTDYLANGQFNIGLVYPIYLLVLKFGNTISFLIFYSGLIISTIGILLMQENGKGTGAEIFHRINPMSNIFVSWNFNNSYVKWGIGYYLVLGCLMTFLLWRSVRRISIGVKQKEGAA